MVFRKASRNQPPKPLKTNSRISPIRLFLKVWVPIQLLRRMGQQESVSSASGWAKLIFTREEFAKVLEEADQHHNSRSCQSHKEQGRDNPDQCLADRMHRGYFSHSL